MQFPAIYKSFKCTVCETINDLQLSVDPEAVGKRCFCISNLSTLAEQFQRGRDKNLLATFNLLIRDCFFSIDNVVATFCQSDGNLCLPLLDEFFKVFSESTSQSIRNSLMLSLNSLLERPRKAISKSLDFQFVLFCLLNPLFMHSKSIAETLYHQRMIQRVFGLASNSQLMESEERLLMRALAVNFDVCHFRRLVDTLNFFLTQRLLVKEVGITKANVYSDWAIPAALRVQRLFLRANEANQKICISEFYNTALDFINLIADFEGWQQQQRERRGSVSLKLPQFFFCSFSFAISLAGKMKILQYESNRYHEMLASQAVVESMFSLQPAQPYLQLKIRRDHLVSDSLAQLSAQGSNLRKRLLVEFEGESGLDAGGLTKEWLLLLVRELFGETYGLFYAEEESRLLWFSVSKRILEKLENFRLCGIIVGLGMYNGVILDLPFPLVVYRKLFGHKGNLEDLRVLMPTFYKSMCELLAYEKSDFREVFSLDNSYYDSDLESSVLLLSKPDDSFVTTASKEEYVHNLVDYLLNVRVREIFDAFSQGFLSVCSGNALSLLRPCEVEVLVSGSRDTQLDIQLIRENSTYSDGFTSDDPFVLCFWRCVESFDEKMKRRLLHFVTGTDRLPSVGSASDFGIRLTCLGSDSERFPIAHTCFNQLCLYRYSTREKLAVKLSSAICECNGFDLK